MMKTVQARFHSVSALQLRVVIGGGTLAAIVAIDAIVACANYLG